MGLDFLEDIVDEEGAAIYLIHDGGGYQERRLTEYSEELKKLTRKQVIVFSMRERDGAQLADFYNILEEQLPAIIIVRDTDELAAEWYGLDLPQPDQVVFEADQVSD
ncbi:hypothetical protein KDA00_04540 [Candidatus Saccharibacteria bacterium]|nr:hypothetical protein [Candidatus Saccharibacteria bacterium]